MLLTQFPSVSHNQSVEEEETRHSFLEFAISALSTVVGIISEMDAVSPQMHSSHV